MISQQVYTGVGVHSGLPSKVELALTGKPGLKIFCNDTLLPIQPGKTSPPPLRSAWCTVAEVGGQSIYQWEHLLACLTPLSYLGIQVTLTGKEFPIGDGSASLWVESILKMGKDLLEPQYSLFSTPIQGQIKNSRGGQLNYTSSDCFEVWVKYRGLEFDTANHVHLDPTLHFSWPPKKKWEHIHTPEGNFPAENMEWEEVLTCRTFMLWKHWKNAFAMGRIRGVRENCGQGFVENESEWEEMCRWLGEKDPQSYPVFWGTRSPNFKESAGHKILDLLGDLAWLGPSLPKLKIELEGVGHAEHLQLLEELLSHDPYTL